MERAGTTLEATKEWELMTKSHKGSQRKKREKKEESMIEVPESYLQALEAIIAEQKLRVLLYQQVISKASEELGVDILKKVGSQWSGP